MEALLPEPASDAQLRALPDNRYLAEMTKCVFRSGFVWKIIENKWPGFEAAFHEFDVSACVMISDEESSFAATSASCATLRRLSRLLVTLASFARCAPNAAILGPTWLPGR